MNSRGNTMRGAKRRPRRRMMRSSRALARYAVGRVRRMAQLLSRRLGDVIDEEEYNLIREMKEFKKSYRTSFDKLKNIKGDVFLIQQNIDQLKQ